MDNILIPHAAVRLSKVSDDQWRLSHLFDKKEYQVSGLIAAIVTLYSGGEDSSSFLLKAQALLGGDGKEKIFKIVEFLKARNILVEVGNSESEFSRKLSEKWEEYGWSEAADYYLSSLSFPFIEGTVYEYNQTDNQTMSAYYDKEPDLNRSKEYDIREKLIPAPSVIESLENPVFNQNSVHVLNGIYDVNYKGHITKEDILLLSSVAFGAFRTRKVDLLNVADTVRKTSPSGGSRHPTEGYIVINYQIEGLEKGVYHFSVKENALEKIHSEVDENIICDTFPGLFRNSARPKVVIVLTTLFERNMYRYREPRTFRSIFIDIGHVSETIRLVSQALGLKYTAHTYIDFPKAEQMLGINPLKEGVFYSVGIC